jgi:hypothetical protein
MEDCLPVVPFVQEMEFVLKRMFVLVDMDTLELNVNSQVALVKIPLIQKFALGMEVVQSKIFVHVRMDMMEKNVNLKKIILEQPWPIPVV